MEFKNKVVIVTGGRNGEETVFQQTIDPEFTGYKEISPEAKSITL